jgi:hypothetical protein
MASGKKFVFTGETALQHLRLSQKISFHSSIFSDPEFVNILKIPDSIFQGRISETIQK